MNIKEAIQQDKLPEEFNQADDLKHLGGSRLGSSPRKNEDGKIDWEDELRKIRKEKNRFKL